MKSAALALLLFVAAAVASASDVWLVQGLADAPTEDPCIVTAWSGDIVLRNVTNNSARVSLKGISNASALLPSAPPFIDVAPGQTKSVTATVGGRWTAFTGGSPVPIWITHLDVPAGVLVEDRIEIGSINNCSAVPPTRTPIYGKISFPAIRALTPANEVQTHLGTDLGAVDARVNVGIYNAAEQPASANVVIRRACDDRIIGERQLAIAANTLVQISITPDLKPLAGGCPEQTTPPWVAYTTVRVDQPSLSYVAMLANQSLCDGRAGVKLPYAISLTQ